MGFFGVLKPEVAAEEKYFSLLVLGHPWVLEIRRGGNFREAGCGDQARAL